MQNTGLAKVSTKKWREMKSILIIIVDVAVVARVVRMFTFFVSFVIISSRLTRRPLLHIHLNALWLEHFNGDTLKWNILPKWRRRCAATCLRFIISSSLVRFHFAFSSFRKLIFIVRKINKFILFVDKYLNLLVSPLFLSHVSATQCHVTCCSRRINDRVTLLRQINVRSKRLPFK